MNMAPFLVAERLSEVQLPQLAASLDRAGLPSLDIARPGRIFFRFLNHGEIVGFGGLEGDPPDLLLRSMVVDAGHRHRGHGSHILQVLEAEARSLGCARLHLLTETAEAFFLRHGFRAADRQVAPVSVARSEEFTALCPASTRYFVKVLPV